MRGSVVSKPVRILASGQERHKTIIFIDEIENSFPAADLAFLRFRDANIAIPLTYGNWAKKILPGRVGGRAGQDEIVARA
jgi:hypothetical protein